jgi:hypothetical protein
MGNNPICKECETFSQKGENNTLAASGRSPVTINVASKQSSRQGPKVEQLPGNRFRIEYESGEVYVGEAVGAVRHGQGRMDWPQGSSYEGAWENDRASGQGTYQENGASYSGVFKDSELLTGKYVSANGKEVYEGQFCNHRF